MHHQSALFVFALFGLQSVLCAPAQIPLEVSIQATRPKHKLQGRFLHITDIHPDPHYHPGMSEESACHRKKPKKSVRRSGEYGMAYSDCDSPYSLTNYTFDFLDKHWADDIDFVIWTGDSARHDNDRKLPRTTKEIYDLNRVMADRMESVFLSKGVPVVPSIGNNDIWPHNIMMPGPNDITFEFSAIWRSFIPFHSYQVFQRGGYYSIEVIPDSVAVISLNTMYFYASNKAVGGCEPREPQDPGNLQFDWLEVQLESFRNRRMQVWISGHVPPSAQNYFPECHVRYVELSLMYQDTILGHLYGHMNADHFFFLSVQDTMEPPAAGSSDEGLGERELKTAKKKKHGELYEDLLKSFSHMPKLSKKLGHDNLAVVNVAPSVVPNPYLPSFRIFSYNISGTRYVAEDEEVGGGGYRLGDSSCGDGVCSDERFEKMERRGQASKEWNSSPKSPSRMNRLWTPLGFAQYYLPGLNTTETGKRPKYKLEYLTYEPCALHPPTSAGVDGVEFVYPVPLKELPGALRNGSVAKSGYAPYGLEDLTIGSWTRLAKRLGKAKHAKLRRRFRRYMYMGAEAE